MPRGQRGRHDASVTPALAPRPRSRCKLDFAPEFEDSAVGLSGLGPTREVRRALATASVRGFFDQWRTKTSATDRELGQGRWKYKPLQGPRARAAKLRQIYLDGPRGIHRAAILVEEGSDECDMIALLAYHKRDQDPTAIDRAAEIAEALRRV